MIARLLILWALSWVVTPYAGATAVGKSHSLGFNTPNGKTSTADFGTNSGGTLLKDLINKNPTPAAGTGMLLEDLLKMPFTPKDFIPDKATVKSFLTPLNIAKALRGAGGAYIAGEAIEGLLRTACVRGMGGTYEMGSGGYEVCNPATQSDGYEYRNTVGTVIPWNPDPNVACKANMDARKAQNVATGNYAPPNGYYNVTGLTCNTTTLTAAWQYDAKFYWGQTASGTGQDQIQKQVKVNCPAGQWVLQDGTCSGTKPVDAYTPGNDAAVEAKIQDAIALPANASKVASAIKELLDKGLTVEASAPTVTGPAASPVSTTVTTNVNNGVTSTTTTTNVTNYVYNNSTVTATQVTTTTVRDAAGNVTSTSTTNGQPVATPGTVDTPPKSDEGAPADTALPPVPDLYERKYPNGMEGIWNEYKPQFTNSGIAQLVNKLMPTVVDGGTCPDWQVNLNFGGIYNYQTWSVAPPCWIWPIAASILLVSALLMARALIFGG